MKLIMMFAAEWHSEPCYMIPTAHVVSFYLLATTNDTASTLLSASGPKLSSHAVIPALHDRVAQIPARQHPRGGQLHPGR